MASFLKSPEDAGHSSANIAHTTHNVRSAIEARFHHHRDLAHQEPPKPRLPRIPIGLPSSPRSFRPGALPSPAPAPPPPPPRTADPPQHPLQFTPRTAAPPAPTPHPLQFTPRTADPRLAPQYDFKLADPRSQHRSSRREKRYGGHYGQPPPPPPPPPQYQAPRSAVPPGYRDFGNSRGAPPSSSHWPNEKTPTSPAYHHHTRRGSPNSPKFHHPPVPHTAHPGGSFPRFDSPKEKELKEKSLSPRIAAAPDSADTSNSKRGCAFLDSFQKVKAALSPNTATKTEFEFDEKSPAYSPIPPPRERVLERGPDSHTNTPRDFKAFERGPDTPRDKAFKERGQAEIYSPREKVPDRHGRGGDTRQYGYYEYQTPSHQTNFDSTRPPLTARSAGPMTPNGERLAQDYTLSVPDDDKYDSDPENGAVAPPEEEQPKKTLKEKLHELIARIRLWLQIKLQRPRSRIPSVQPDLETQEIEKIEQELREAYVLSWITVAGAWIVQFTTFGYIWSWGVFQDYYLNNFPEVHTSAKGVAWIGSLQLTMAFAFGILSGKLFDAGWFHFSMILGSLLFGMGSFTLSLVDPSKFIHLFLVQGLFMGAGLGLVFVPSVLVVQLHFPERKGLMTGIVMSGSSFGALLYPIMLDKLLPSKGFTGAVRATSYMIVALLVIANCLVSLPPKKWAPRFPPVNLIGYLKEIHYAVACGAVFVVFLTMWFPQYYIEEFAVKHGVNPHLAFYSLAIMSAGGMVGRVALGFAADRFGAWTVLIPVTFVVMLMVCFVGLLKNAGAVVLVSFIYGFSSGGWLSLLISALSTLAARQGELGHRVGFALSVASLGSFLTGTTQAALLSKKWTWAAPIGFFAFLLLLAIGAFGYVRHLISVKRRFAYV